MGSLQSIRMAVGVAGNAASLILYAVPILTFWRVIKKKSTEEFSCVPYIIALMNCLLYTWYGLPIVSKGWENFPVVTINGLGILLELSFIFIYFWFTSPRRKKNVALKLGAVVTVFSCVGIISTFVLHSHHLRKLFVGSIGLVASVAMYSSPLVAMKQVLKTKSVEYMPFYLSFFSFSASSLWLAYGLLSHDLFLASPNLVGSPVGLLQIVLYCIYRNKEQHQVVEKEEEKDAKEPLPNWDLEKNHNNNNADHTHITK